jgi:hypothetical protein
MTVLSLTRLLDAGATTTARSGEQHMRKLPERARAVNQCFRFYVLDSRTNASSLQNGRRITF